MEDKPEHLPRAVLSPLFKNSSTGGSEELSPVKCLFGILICSLSQLILLTHKACLSLVCLNPIQAAPSLQCLGFQYSSQNYLLSSTFSITFLAMYYEAVMPVWTVNTKLLTVIGCCYINLGMKLWHSLELLEILLLLGKIEEQCSLILLWFLGLNFPNAQAGSQPYSDP